MPVSVDFETQLRGPWETAQGFLVEQLQLLQAQTSPIFPLIDGLQNSITSTTSTLGVSGYPTSTVLITNSLGDPNFSQQLPCPLGFNATNVITPVQLTANTNDYAPPNVQSAAVIRINSSIAIDLTGLLAASISHMKMLVNVGGNTITVKQASASSAVINRFRCPGAADYSLTQSKAVWIWYDSASTVWQVIGA